MLVRRSKIDALWEARVEDLKDAHSRELQHLVRTLDVLAEQIDYLRALVGMPHMPKVAAINPAQQPPMQEGWMPWVTDEEEDIEHLRSLGVISDHEADALAEQIREEFGLENLTVE